MNNREFECVRILTDLVENYGLVGVKTSFEDFILNIVPNSFFEAFTKS